MSGTKQAERCTDVSSAIADLTTRIGRCPNATELAADLGIDREELIDEVLRIGARVDGSLHRTGNREDLDDPELAERIARSEYELAKSINVADLSSILDMLSTEERSVVVMRLSNAQSQSEIAERLQLSPQAVTAILARALAFIRDRI